jgi:hypothetical protein
VLGSLKVSVREIRAEMGLNQSELAGLSRFRCWERKKCPPGVRERCIAYVTSQGHLCWFLTGTICEGRRQKSWSDNMRLCLDRGFMQGLLRPVKTGTERDVTQR